MAGRNWTVSFIRDHYLEIDGRQYKLVHYVSSFAINEIPRAECYLALGRRADRLSVKAELHESASTLTRQLPAKVVFSPAGEYDNRRKRWPKGARTIFEGYFMGMGYRKLHGRVMAVAHLIHWLADLTYSSCLSKLSHPSNPGQLTYKLFQLTTDTGIRGRPINIGQHIGSELLQVHLGEDIWKGIKRFLVLLANTSLMDFDLNRVVAGDPDGIGNTAALAALARIEGPSESPESKDYQWAEPIRFIDTDARQQMIDSLTLAINNEQVQSFFHATFWDYLISAIAPMLKIALIPRVDDALVVPMIPGLRSTWRKEISIDDYDSIDTNALRSRPLRAVAIHSPFGTPTGIDVNAPPNIYWIGGFYRPGEDDTEKGVILNQTPPPWLMSLSTSGVPEGYAASSTGVQNNTAPRTSTTAIAKVGDLQPAGPQPTQTAVDANDIFDRWAHAVYVEETLRGRTGVFHCPLRFDICPGSSILIRGSAERFLGKNDTLATDLYGLVTRMTISIGAEQRECSTTYQCAYLRSPEENKSDRTSLDEHPLYQGKFLGAPLVDDYLLD